MVKQVMTTLLTSLISVSMLGASQSIVNVREWVGNSKQSVIEKYGKRYVEKLELTVEPNTQVITNITAKNKGCLITPIKLGESVEKIKKIYPKDWIAKEEYLTSVKQHKILILLERDTHFGVATKYITYWGKENKKIDCIQTGYTNFRIAESILPKSNKEANDWLQGTWRQGARKMKFEDGYIQDSKFDTLYDAQNYTVLSPNELLLTSYTKDTVSQVYLRFSINKNKLYLYVVDELGVPIKESIEILEKSKIY